MIWYVMTIFCVLLQVEERKEGQEVRAYDLLIYVRHSCPRSSGNTLVVACVLGGREPCAFPFHAVLQAAL